MKRFIVAVLLMLALPTMGQDKKNQTEFAQLQKRLTGVWQQCLPMVSQNGFLQLRFAPIFKILHSDGTFNNMLLANSIAPAAFSATGKWYVASDSTFVEHLSTLASEHETEGKDNELTFNLTTDDNFLDISDSMPGKSRRSREIWIRVQKGNTKDVAEKYLQNFKQ